MTTIEAFPSCEMVAVSSFGKRYMSFRRSDVKRITDTINPSTAGNATLLEFYDHHDDLFIDMPFDAVFGLLNVGDDAYLSRMLSPKPIPQPPAWNDGLEERA